MARGLILTELLAPEEGARSDLVPYRLTDQAVPAANTQNVVLRNAAVANRPGFQQINANTVTGRPMGGFLFKTGASEFTVVGTTTRLMKLNSSGSNYDNITGSTTPTGTADDPWKFAVFPTDFDWLIGTNKVNTPQKWNGVAGTFVDVGGSPPIAGDVTVAANRVILVDTIEPSIHQYRVRWSGFNDEDSWDALDFADLSDTPDVMVATRALSRVAFAIYKEHSQWIGLSQTGEFPFKFEMQDLKPGPVGPAAVVVANGQHYYLAVDGSIYLFDGIRATHIGEPVRRYILQNLDFDHKRRTFGYYSRRDRDIYWWFCEPGADDPTIGVSLQIDTGRFFPHVLRKSLGCGFEGSLAATTTWDSLSGFTWANISGTYATWNSFGSPSSPVEIVGGVDGLIHQFGVAATDDGQAPSAKWRYESRQLAGPGFRARVESVDSFFPVTSTAQDVTISVGITDTLGTDPSFPAALSTTIDIGASDAERRQHHAQAAPGYGPNTAEARFVTLKYELDTETDWAWLGAHVFSYPERTAST